MVNAKKKTRKSKDESAAKKKTKRKSDNFFVVSKCCVSKCFHAILPEEQRFLYDNFQAGDKPSKDRILGSYLQFRKMNGRKVNDPNARNRIYQWSYIINVFNSSIRVCRKFIETLFCLGPKHLRIIQKRL